MKFTLLYIFMIIFFGQDVVAQQTHQSDGIKEKKKRAINNVTKDENSYYSVEDAMKANGIPGLSVAVIDNYKIVWQETWGVKDMLSREPIDKNTAFSTASISKPVTATLFAMLEERGLIHLSDPVSKYLKRWKFPESDFTKNVEITFEHLLSHTAGTTQHGFEDYYKGDTIPNLVQSLKGQLQKRYKSEIEVKWTPGTHWGYSGGGYVIAQMAVEDSLGKTLAELADEYLFNPLGLRNTSFKQPNEIGFLTNIAKAHDKFGKIIRTGLPITPQLSASGLWSTPTDLAAFILEIQNALRNTNNLVISNKVARRVTNIVTSKVLGGWSLGWERRFGYGNYDWFSHGGANTGIGGYIYGTMTGGKGIIFLSNSDDPSRTKVIDQFRNSIIKTHKWYIPINKAIQKNMSSDLINMILGRYSHVLFPEEVEIIKSKKGLAIKNFIGNGINELIYIGNNTFIIDGSPSKMKIDSKASDGKISIILMRNNTTEQVLSYKKILK